MHNRKAKYDFFPKLNESEESIYSTVTAADTEEAFGEKNLL